MTYPEWSCNWFSLCHTKLACVTQATKAALVKSWDIWVTGHIFKWNPQFLGEDRIYMRLLLNEILQSTHIHTQKSSLQLFLKVPYIFYPYPQPVNFIGSVASDPHISPFKPDHSWFTLTRQLSVTQRANYYFRAIQCRSPFHLSGKRVCVCVCFSSEFCLDVSYWIVSIRV